MTILSDRQIRKLCIPPTHIVRKMAIDDRKVTWYPPTREIYTDDELQRGIAAGTIDSEYVFPVQAEELAKFRPMITPFVNGQVRTKTVAPHLATRKIISYGLSSFGYDVRLADTFKIFTNINSTQIDPLAMDPQCYVDYQGPFCIIPPNSYILGHTMETFDIPRDVMVICLGKSTYARAGAIVNVTPIEAGFIGSVVIEISNSTPLPLKVYAGMGVAQFLFLQGEECETSYADRGGKYQHQQGLQTAIV